MHNELAEKRHHEMLYTAFGKALVEFLEREDVIEIMVNPDGHVWLDTLTNGKYFSNITLSLIERLNIIKLVASLNQLVVNEKTPELSCELGFVAARFQAWIFPVSAYPTFTIRKKARRIFTLEDYVANGWLSIKDADYLKNTLHQRLNILIAGGTGSGKTTFANALLHELENSNDRIVVLEDLPELQLSAKDVVHLRTTETINMRDLVRGCLRMRPDRIIIGEVRDGAALEMLKAWNTGHPGGLCTLHANSADSVLTRLSDLILEVVPQVPQHLLHETVDVILFMQKSGSKEYAIAEIKPISAIAKKTA